MANHARRIGMWPKGPMSAYIASPPVTARKAAPRMAKLTWNLAMRMARGARTIRLAVAPVALTRPPHRRGRGADGGGKTCSFDNHRPLHGPRSWSIVASAQAREDLPWWISIVATRGIAP